MLLIVSIMGHAGHFLELPGQVRSGMYRSLSRFLTRQAASHRHVPADLAAAAQMTCTACTTRTGTRPQLGRQRFGVGAPGAGLGCGSGIMTAAFK